MKNKKIQKKETKKSSLGKIWSRKQIVVLGLVFLTATAGIFVWRDYQAKGATYGWIQAGWGGGLDTDSVTGLASHEDNRENWTKYYSADTNVVAGDTVTLASGSTNVQHTSSAEFDSGTKTGAYMVDPTSVSGQVTANFNYYNANGLCTGFKGVYYIDSGTATWANALTTCTSLCSTCALPSLTELQCMYTNRASFGNNLVASEYWSATERNSTDAYFVYFVNGATFSNSKSLTLSVRCVRR